MHDLYHLCIFGLPPSSMVSERQVGLQPFSSVSQPCPLGLQICWRKGTQAGRGIMHFDYEEPWPAHFIHSGRGRTVDDKAEWRRAWLRREMRGIVMRNTGEVVARGLHKFFNLGQLAEVKFGVLQRKQIAEVLVKLDGQMLMGVVIDTEVQFWSRKGHTVTGKTAHRIAGEGHAALVLEAHNAGCTAVFEMIGP